MTPLSFFVRRDHTGIAPVICLRRTELPSVMADALRLRFFGELKFQEIADAMSCSISTAKNRVRWGLEEIGERMADSDSGSVPRTGEYDLPSAGDSR